MSCEISVVVCTYTDRRSAALREAISSLHAQTLRPHEIVVVVDHEPALLERLGSELEGAVVLPSKGPRGLAGCRNTGARAATGSVVAFIDDDALAEPEWLERLAQPYEDEGIIAVGGAVLPRWSRTRPAWFPPEFDWVVGCSYRGMPEARTSVRNLIGANMSFRREVFQQLEFFSGLGHAQGRSLGGEETDLCIRLGQARPAQRIVYEPRARVHHHVPPERARFLYFLRRCYNEGRSKGVLTRRVGSSAGLASEKAYVRNILPKAALHSLAEAVETRRAPNPFQVVATVVGVAAAMSGYVLSRLRRLSTMS
jgi:glycosyltransferase involved in cell wall biosynthesis